MNKYALFISIFFCLLISYNVLSQVSHGGMPESFNYQIAYEKTECIEVTANYDSINNFINTRCTQNCRLHVGCFINNNEYSSKQNIGKWYKSTTGNYFYILTFRLKNAKGIGISFSNIEIPEGCNMFVYNQSKSFVLGAYTNENISDNKQFTIEPVEGEFITIEFDNLQSKDINFNIEGFSYFFDFNYIKKEKGTGFGASGDCEVNVHCPEGTSVNNVANSVLRLLILDNGGWFLCTGSLINNTLQDYKPYVLTAFHCGEDATPMELDKWIFYFLYESANCDNPEKEPEHKTLVGCKKIAGAEYYSNVYNVGSDFYLALLNDSIIPNGYNPFFAGWDISDKQEDMAKCVHHPSGDIKKVSFTDNISSNCFFIENYPTKTHWKVIWAETESGYGVTEGGSSGSPLINDKQQIIGILSGGTSHCTKLQGPDYFGKMSYSWDKNGDQATRRLDHWLDPNESGVKYLNGITDDLSISKLNINLKGSTKSFDDLPSINVGSTLNFSAVFNGNPDSCYWEFEGGTPSSITLKPEENIDVTYTKYGNYNVNLTLYKKQTNDTNYYSKHICYSKYISVVPVLYPNPFQNKITIITGENMYDYQFSDITLLKLNGDIVAHPTKIYKIDNKIEIFFPEIRKGFYILNIKDNNTNSAFNVIKQQ